MPRDMLFHDVKWHPFCTLFLITNVKVPIVKFTGGKLFKYKTGTTINTLHLNSQFILGHISQSY